MKNAVTLGLAAALAASIVASSIAPPAYAQRAQSSQSSDADVSVTVIIIRDYIGPDDFQQVPRTYRYPSARTYARGQDEIRSNAKIRSILRRRGIASRNVAGVQTAFSGGKIVYVR